ncbi:hypothetical protein CGZ93_17940 [Enemella dayhoffiae]|uniref:Uncharacterized protein n=1 Tax=Enemella dayhoffiae TaxID=2016507 RepID=A0A255GMM0_9ACTN|nr:hypothetical protein [Enemella dayhoffiae]OYO16642.1 hypothetical protein CGZ93_17940 [Enemella dayhoffiae]
MYSVRLADTLTGQVGATLPAAATGSWADAINGPTSCEVKVPTSWLLRQPRERWAAWSASLLVCWDGHPLVWGPILDDPEGDEKFVTLKAGGLWSLLAHRVVTDRDYGDAGVTRAQITATAMGWLKDRAPEDVARKAVNELLDSGAYAAGSWTGDKWSAPVPEGDPIIYHLQAWRGYHGATLGESVVALREGSLGTIARRLVELAQLRPNGWFPIRYASPEELGTNRERTYEGFNLGNNSVAKRLEEISEVVNGPDLAFRPEWVPGMEGSRVQWAMCHGTEAMPELWQEHSHVLDLTARKGKAVAKKLTSKFLPVRRVYATGAGQDQGTLIRVETEPEVQGLPHLETVIADTQVEDWALLSARARGVLEQGRQVQLAASVSAHDFPPHTNWAGEAWDVHMPGGFVQLEKGTYRMRCLSRSGKFDSHVVDLEMQPEEMIA